MDNDTNRDGIIPDSSMDEETGVLNTQSTDTPDDETATSVLFPQEDSDETVDDVSDAGETEQSDLDGELETIAEMFQTAIDNGGVLQNEDGSEIEAADEIDDSLCKCCGVNLRDVSEDEENPYCEHCMLLMRNRKFGAAPFLTILVVLVVGLLTTIFTSDKLEGYLTALQADASLFSAERYDALNGYNSYFSTLTMPEDAGNLVALRAAKAFVNLGYYSDAADIVDTYFTESELKNPIYSAAKSIKKEYAAFNGTYNYINTVLSSIDSDGTAELQDLMDTVESLRGANPLDADPEADFEEYDEFVIDYYKYMIVVNKDRPLTEQREQLDVLAEKYPDRLWAYGANYCNICVRLGDAETAKEYYDKVKNFNSSDSTVDAYYANIYRFSEKNADKMLEILNPAIEANPSSELYRMAAIAYIMQGDYESAYNSAYSAYSSASYSGGYTFQMLYTVSLCALLTDNSEVYDSIESMLQSSGYEMSKEIVDYANGTISLDDIIYNAEGDLA